jgi:dipeptide/tripeptide permease
VTLLCVAVPADGRHSACTKAARRDYSVRIRKCLHAVGSGAGSIAGFTMEQVEEVRMVVRMLPIFVTTIFYWTIYSQVRSNLFQSLTLIEP